MYFSHPRLHIHEPWSRGCY